MARNHLNLSFPRFCPKCGSQLIKNERASRDRTRWDCPNPPEKCEIISVSYTAFSKGHDFEIKKIFYETRPRLHYTTHLIYQTDISDSKGGGA